MIRLAWRNLLQSKTRLVISVGGTALALMLIIALDAIVTGIERRVTAYIDNSGADIWVSQQNVRNMHMAYSALPASVTSRLKGVAGVADATPILYLTGDIEMGRDHLLVVVIGLPDAPIAGGPWHIVEGAATPATGDIVVDRGLATRAGVALGDTVKIFGEEFTVGGFSEGTASATGGSVAFVSRKDWHRLQSDDGTVSFVLVRVTPGESPEAVAARIERTVDKVTAQSRQAFAAQERQVVKDMSTDIIAIMNTVGFTIGLAVMALTVYVAVLARRAEYGILKAVGARNGHLYVSVLAQAFASVALGFAAALVFTLALSFVVPRLGTALQLDVSAEALAKAASMALAIAAFSAVLPVWQIANLDPARVFRGK